MKISLIITVYNKQDFLNHCLDSVVGQTDQSAQVIIVDDGSTDGSAEICDSYARQYGFEVYHTENNGVSEARNLGMDKATGDYITFLDADDALTPDAIEIMGKVATRGYNIHQFGQYRRKKYAIDDGRKYSSPKGHYGFDFIPKYWVMVWNKLYKRIFIEDYYIRFKKGMQFGEDTLFNAQCILANGGFYHAPQTTIIHCLDDKKSLCRGDLSLDKLELLDEELCKLEEAQFDDKKKAWVGVAIDEHRNSRLFRRYGFGKGNGGKYDIVYFVKKSPTNEELVYSLRSVEKNWKYRSVWFCGGCPDNLRPDQMLSLAQQGTSKWNRVKDMIVQVCKNDHITENFWLFNDDFFVLKPLPEDMPPQYNGELLPYVERIERRQGHADDYTRRLRCASEALEKAGKTTLNYEVHKPMLINRKKALEVLEVFPNTPAFRSLYGNYLGIGGVSKHDMKIKTKKYSKMHEVENNWDFVSTSDTSFEEGDVGEFLRMKFTEKSRFEK